MTADTMAGDRERCLAAGMDDYIGKPVRADDLDRAIARALAGAGAGGGLEDRSPTGGRPPLFEASQLAGGYADDDAERRALLELFVSQAGATVEQLGAAVVAGDGDAVQRLTHGLTGSSATVGALQLADASERLGESARTDELAGAADLQAALRSSFEATRAEFA
jgi:CheY-like chemotaxis protein